MVGQSCLNWISHQKQPGSVSGAGPKNGETLEDGRNHLGLHLFLVNTPKSRAESGAKSSLGPSQGLPKSGLLPGMEGVVLGWKKSPGSGPAFVGPWPHTLGWCFKGKPRGSHFGVPEKVSEPAGFRGAASLRPRRGV